MFLKSKIIYGSIIYILQKHSRKVSKNTKNGNKSAISRCKSNRFCQYILKLFHSIKLPVSMYIILAIFMDILFVITDKLKLHYRIPMSHVFRMTINLCLNFFVLDVTDGSMCLVVCSYIIYRVL